MTRKLRGVQKIIYPHHDKTSINVMNEDKTTDDETTEIDRNEEENSLSPDDNIQQIIVVSEDYQVKIIDMDANSNSRAYTLNGGVTYSIFLLQSTNDPLNNPSKLDAVRNVDSKHYGIRAFIAEPDFCNKFSIGDKNIIT